MEYGFGGSQQPSPVAGSTPLWRTLAPFDTRWKPIECVSELLVRRRDRPITSPCNRGEAVKRMSGKGSLRSSELRGSVIGGLVATAALFAMVVLVGQVGSFEALRLIESVLPGARFLASAVMGGSLTVLALLLTLLGLAITSDFTFHPRLYTRVSFITNLSVVSIIVSVALLLAVGVPIQEVEEVRPYYAVLYYVLAAGMAVLGGIVVSMGLMIGSTLRGLVNVQHPDAVSDLLSEED
jgi:hypothetical protein